MMGLHLTGQKIDRYLDQEMLDSERECFLAHYNECESCRAQVESRYNLVHAVREARPEFRASDDLRRNIAALLLPQPQPSRFHKWKSLFFPSGWSLGWRPVLRYAWLLPILIAAGSAFYLSQQQTRAHQLVDTAIDTHQRRLAGAVPIDFRSASARDVTRWCNAKLHFGFRLPTYQDDSGDRSRYQLIGASRISFRGKDAAYIAYEMGKERLSLLVVSDDQAIASGGETTRAKSLVFHSNRRNRLEVLTWSVHHLTYALVSNVDLPPKQSCVVCHANPKDRQWLQSSLVHRKSSFRRDRTLGENPISVLDRER